MKYIQHVNELIGKKTAATERLVLFGQNIAAGSHLSGLTKGLKVGAGGHIINTPNIENTLAGLGFGMMLKGVSSIFFMKQLDFLLLGIDQLVHSYNFIRRKEPKASYTIFAIISDLGYHGLQSSFNNFGDICSVARVPGYVVTNYVDAKEIIETHLVSPGFRIIGVCQRLFGQELLELETVFASDDRSVFQYKEGTGATVVAFNGAFPYGLELWNKLKEKGTEASLFSVNAVTPVGWEKIIEDLKRTKKLVLLDDGKSANSSADNFLVEAAEKCDLKKKIVVKRDLSGAAWLFPNPDLLEVDYEGICKELM